MFNLENLRLKSGKSQREVAIFMEISELQYCHLEKEVSVINANQILKLCELYKCSPNEILAFNTINKKIDYNQKDLDESQKTFLKMAYSYVSMLKTSDNVIGYILSVDYGYYPIFHSIRHALELLLKSNMIQIIKSDINEYDQMLKDITNSHDIKFLFQKYEDNFTEIKSNHYYEFIKTTIIDINTYDRNSQCLRYAVDKNYKVDKKPRKIFREINWDDDKGLKILHNSILGSEFKNYEVENQDLLDMINNGYLTFICLRMYNEYWNQ